MRQDKPFVHVNCAAIPYNLIESELFGYEDGAFTGAKKGGKAGYFEIAQGGTLFLDEITEMPMSLQGKLLEVLQDKTYFRVGGEKEKELMSGSLQPPTGIFPNLLSSVFSGRTCTTV